MRCRRQLVFFKLVRLIVGPIILFLDFVTSPKGVERPQAEQDEIDNKTRSLVLYQFRTCPFCIKTRRAMRRLNLPIETRNAAVGSPHRDVLEQGGGRIQVPCLYLEEDGEEVWMYESGEIIAYLEQRFGTSSLFSQA